MTNITCKSWGCVVHRVKGYRRTRDHQDIVYISLCGQERGSWYNVETNKIVSCVRCGNILERVREVHDALYSHDPNKPLNVILKFSGIVHRVVNHQMGKHEYAFKSACGRWFEERGSWRSPIIVEGRETTCKNCLRVLAARKRKEVIPE